MDTKTARDKQSVTIVVVFVAVLGIVWILGTFLTGSTAVGFVMGLVVALLVAGLLFLFRKGDTDRDTET